MMISVIALIYWFIQISKMEFPVISCRLSKILAFNTFKNYSAITGLPSFCVEYIKISTLFKHSCIRFSWAAHNLFGFQLNSFTISIKALRTALPFLSFKGLNHGSAVKTYITNNKCLTFLSLKETFCPNFFF